MKNKSLILGAVAVAVLLVAAGLWFWRQPQPPSAPVINVAANLPMSGPLSVWGSAIREGATMALDEEAATDLGPLPGIVVDWQDNASDAKTAVSVYQKQMLGNPAIYVSGVKPQTMAIKDEVARQGIPHFVWIFDAHINQQSSNNFRTLVSYKIEPPVYLDYIKRRAPKRIAIAYVQLPHTVEEFEQILIPQLKQQGNEDIFAEAYDFGRSDFKDIALKIAKFKPDLIILNGFQSDLVGLIRSLRPLGAITDGNTIATYDLIDAAQLLGPDELEGIRMVAPLFETRPQSDSISSWKTRFSAKYGRPPIYANAFAYDMIGAIRAASRTLSHPASHQQWIDALRGVDLDGITGRIRFDADGDMITPLEVGVYRSGRLVPDSPAQ